jgi:hypothetical protein
VFVQFGAAGGHSKAPPGLLHAVSRSALLTCTHTSLCDTYMHTPLRAHTASMRLCVSLCLHPSLPASHATHTHRVSLQEGVWLHAGERVRRRWPLRGRPSAVRQVSDGRRSHCVTHTHTPLPGRVRTVEVWRKVRTVCARASGVWPCMHAQACRGLRVCVVPSQVPLP